MNRKALLIALLTILTCKISLAQNSPEDIVSKFFDLYKTGSDTALNYIFSTNKYFKENQGGVDDLKRKLNKVLAVDGQNWGYDLLWKKKAGDNFILLTFLVRHDRDPITFRLVFYKPHGTWVLQHFTFSTKMDEELEEASKVSLVKDASDK